MTTPAPVPPHAPAAHDEDAEKLARIARARARWDALLSRARTGQGLPAGWEVAAELTAIGPHVRFELPRDDLVFRTRRRHNKPNPTVIVNIPLDVAVQIAVLVAESAHRAGLLSHEDVAGVADGRGATSRSSTDALSEGVETP